MTGEVALIEEQGVRFAVVAVKPSVLRQPQEAAEVVWAFTREFGVPAVLMSSDGREVYGRDDLASFLADIPPDALPWREFSMN